jgi:hypothetical protein
LDDHERRVSDVMRKLAAAVGLTLLVGGTLAPGLMHSPASAEASGGTITHFSIFDSEFAVHTFTSSGTFTVPAGASIDVAYLLVCGGGGGGSYTNGASNAAAGGAAAAGPSATSCPWVPAPTP